MTDEVDLSRGEGRAIDGLASVVRERIASLAPDARDALAVIAIGGPLPQGPAIQELGLEALLVLERAQLARSYALASGPDVRLADPRYRDIVLDTPGVARAAVAARAAAILRASGGAAAERRVLELQVDTGTRSPAAEVVAAARDADGGHRDGEVARLLAGVVEDGRATPAERAEAHLLLGTAAADRGALTDADRHLVRAAELAPTPALHARAVARRARALADQDGRPVEAEAVLRDGLRDLHSRWPSAVDTAPWVVHLQELLRPHRPGGIDGW